jgi:hypothetical protein
MIAGIALCPALNLPLGNLLDSALAKSMAKPINPSLINPLC